MHAASVMRVKAINDYTVEVLGEKHTLLNLIRWSIANFEKEREIELVGYTIPHPMEDKALVKIQLKDAAFQTKKEILGVFQRGVEASQRVAAQFSTEADRTLG
ncbi:DNA-directed RNA polymerases I and III subunit RPAC2 [Nematocida sp. AWRm77]|nr:DNA-directed RNA polymerases I and III subunit RPAC2 [Nematocida sp. AWRm77]